MAIINGTTGNDVLNSTASSDQIFGFAGDDILNGGGGNDRLDGGIGADAMSGGTGNDIYFVDDIGDSVFENDGEGTDDVRTTLVSYVLGSFVEKLRFTGSGSFTGTGNDLSNEIEGGGSADTIHGGDGHDYLIGRGGSDSLYGGTGADTLDGGSGDDYLEGNDGNDVYLVDSSGDTVVELAGEGTDEVYTTLAAYTLGSHVENLRYNSFTGDFTGTGNALDNVISGGSGNDSLSGLDGADTLTGGSGNDALDGGNGDDVLNGEWGADTMTGGAGADLFRIGYWQSGTGADADRITDFAAGSDLIDVSGWDADLNTGGNQAFTFIGGAAFSNSAGELRSYFDGTDTRVEGDIGGDGIADFEVVLSGAVTVAATDFIL